MKLTTPFTILGEALKNKKPEKVACSIYDLEVPIEECAVKFEANKEESNLAFWDEECEGHPTNSHCKVYDD